jgi:hypothetical protein
VVEGSGGIGAEHFSVAPFGRVQTTSAYFFPAIGVLVLDGAACSAGANFFVKSE